MKCPVCCTVDLQLTVRPNIETDYCPTCRVIWLDRGEPDKIPERSMTGTSMGYRNEPRFDSSSRGHHGGYHDDDHDYYFDPGTGKRKRKGWPLGFSGALFD